MNEELSSYIEKLLKQSPEISSIWLFGSRANGTAKETSDWDLLVFGSEKVFNSIKGNCDLKNDFIDLMVVVDSENLASPWSNKRGQLSDWQWKEISSSEATYIGTKEPTDGTAWYRSETKKQKAIKVWPK